MLWLRTTAVHTTRYSICVIQQNKEYTRPNGEFKRFSIPEDVSRPLHVKSTFPAFSISVVLSIVVVQSECGWLPTTNTHWYHMT